jgi:2-dehydropantoate 2-reductase
VGNGSSNPLSVVSGATLDRLFAEPGLRALVETVMLEIMALGAGLGVRFPMDVQARIAVGQRLGAFRTSMLQDFDLGRPLELGAIADAPLELAERLRMPMPTTRLVRDLARAAERSRDLRRRPPP